MLLRRSELATIAQLPNWDVFSAVVEESIDEIKRIVMANAMSDQGISLEQQAYYRGKIVGLRAARSIPSSALTKQLTESSPKEGADSAA